MSPAVPLVLAAALATAASPLTAQPVTPPPEPSPPITGRVVDTSGGAVADADVRVLATGGLRRIRTAGDGRFTVAPAGACPCTLVVAAPGFAEARLPLKTAASVGSVVLRVGPLVQQVTVTGERVDAVRQQALDHYNANKTTTSLEGETVERHSPVSNYDALRLLPGVMTAGGTKDRFSVPTHLRGASAWGTVEQLDDYPAINITPVSAEDGGYTASFSSIIPSIALTRMTLATGGLGVSYGQASGGIVRSGIKRGTAQGPHSTVRVDGMAIGEGVALGDTGGMVGRLDYYVAGQSVVGEYGDAYATFARPIESLRLVSGLAKVGYRAGDSGRLEALFVGGDETHDYYQLANDAATGRSLRRDFHTAKQNTFVATRYDTRLTDNLLLGAGLTHNRFHENRVEDAFEGVNVDLSRRNRPQQATRLFASLDWRRVITPALTYTATGGMDLSWDRYRDITTTPIAFAFREQAAYWRNSLVFRQGLTVNTGLRAVAIDDGFETRHPLLVDAGVAYALPSDTRLRASYSTGYKLNKAFYLWWGGGQFIQRPGSSGLRPSRTETTEVSLEQGVRPGRRSSGTVRVSVYDTSETDLFNFGNTGTGIPFYDDARVRGAELWTEWRVGRLRPFGSFTWLRTERTRSTNPDAANVDLRFTPLPNYAASVGTHADVSPRLALTVMGYYDDGGVNEQAVNDDLVVTRFQGFFKANGMASYQWTERVTVLLRVENLFNQRDLGYSRSVLGADGSTQRLTGIQRDPGTIIGGGVQVRF